VPDHFAVASAAVAAFVVDDYETCVRIVEDVFPSTIITNIQLWLISLQRLDQAQLLGEFEQTYLEEFAAYPWEYSLICLTLGKIDIGMTLGLAADEEKECEATYYAAERCITFGEIGQARSYFERCVAMNVKGLERRMAEVQLYRMTQASPAYPSSRNEMLGRLRLLEDLKAKNEMSTAIGIARKLEESARNVVVDDSVELRLLLGIGSVYFNTEHFMSAAPLLAAALEALRRIDGLIGTPLHDNVVEAYGRTLLHLEQAAQAVPALEESVAMRKVLYGDTHRLYGQALHNLGAAHVRLGNIEIAQTLLEEALEIAAHERKKDYASTLNALSEIHALMGNKVRAEELLREAAEIHRSAGDIDAYHVALINLAGLKHREGKLAEARTLIELIIGERSNKPIGTEIDISALTWLAELLMLDGRYEEALSQAVSARDAALRILGSTHVRLLELAELTAIAAFALNRGYEAKQALDDLLRQLDARLRQVAVSTTARGRARIVKLIRESAERALALLCERLSVVENSAEIVGRILLNFKGIEVRLAALRSSPLFSDTHDMISDIDRVAAQQHDLEMTGPSKGAEGYRSYLAEQARLQDERDELELRLSRLIDTSAVVSPDLQAVAQSLPEGWALVEFARTHRADLNTGGLPVLQRSGYVAVVLLAGPNAAPLAIDLGSADAIDEAIKAYREVLGQDAPSRASLKLIQAAMSGTDAELLTELGHAIKRRIFDPLMPHLGSFTNLLIAPDGEVSSLPFETLPYENGKYLIDAYVFSYIGSGAELLWHRPVPADEFGPSIVVAAPDYDLAMYSREPTVGPEDGELRGALADRHFTPLAETEEEGRLIAEVLGVRPWLGAEALKARVTSIRRPRFLHIATHGYYMPNTLSTLAESLGVEFGVAAEDLIEGRFEAGRLSNPFLCSGLALAGANVWLSFGTPPAEAGNGLLTADDVMRMHLNGTELTVLSACETGIGQVRNLEGVAGLRRAFAIAGSRAMIVSMWKVADRPTRELFVYFYSHLFAGKPSLSALRSAQLELRERYPHPRHWGSFIHQGVVRD